MPAYCTTKCPQCDKVTSHFLDSALESDRVEYDGKRCKRCVKTTHPDGRKKPQLGPRSRWRWPSKKTMALWTPGNITHY